MIGNLVVGILISPFGVGLAEDNEATPSILLFQDLALVPLLIMLPAMAHPCGDLAATLAIRLASPIR